MNKHTYNVFPIKCELNKIISDITFPVSNLFISDSLFKYFFRSFELLDILKIACPTNAFFKYKVSVYICQLLKLNVNQSHQDINKNKIQTHTHTRN